jgi:hypothetical protein
MVGKEINGKIVITKNLPESIEVDGGTMHGFNNQSKDFVESHGYYPVVKPSIDSETQSLGNVYFDKKKKVFTREIIDFDFNTVNTDEDGVETPAYDLAAKKVQIIATLKGMCGSMLSGTDWQVIRLSERGIAIDEDVATERAEAIAKCDEKEAEVNSLTTYLEALKYSTIFFPPTLGEDGIN